MESMSKGAKCVVCWKMEAPVGVNIMERLCPKCEASHWKKVVGIYADSGNKKKYVEAKQRLAEAMKKVEAK
jgi:hypothetical protein